MLKRALLLWKLINKTKESLVDSNNYIINLVLSTISIILIINDINIITSRFIEMVLRRLRLCQVLNQIIVGMRVCARERERE